MWYFEQKDFIKSKFDFLIDNGYIYLGVENTNIIFILKYQKGDLIISVSYDIWDKIIEVYLRNINNHDPVHLLTNIFDAKISTEEEIKKLKESIDNIYQESKKYKYGMPKEHYEAIVILYADFVEKNLKEIARWEYNKN